MSNRVGFNHENNSSRVTFVSDVSVPSGGRVNPTEVDQGPNYDGMQRNGTEAEYKGTQIIGPNAESGELAVVGWLVCLSEIGKGRDYRLHAGYNIIGRGQGADVSLPDNSVSGRMCRIGYDQRGNKYYIALSDEAKNMVYVNNLPLLQMTELQNYDRISMGGTELMFVALCGEKFSWEE